MTKKEYILKILDAVMDYWPLAKGLKILVESNEIDQKTMDTLVDIFSATVDEVMTAQTQEKLKKSKEILEKIKTIEREHHTQDQKEIEELDTMLQTL